MTIPSSFCKVCGCLIYSRSIGDSHSCDCGNINLVGDKSGRVFFKDSDNIINMVIDGDTLLSQILHYDYMFGNRTVADEFLDGWHGKFKIRKGINMDFYEKLVGVEGAFEFVDYLAGEMFNNLEIKLDNKS